MRHTLIRRAVVMVGVTALTLPFAAGAHAAPSRHTLSGSTPSWATPSHQSGTTAAKKTISVQVNLNLRHAADAERLASDVATPGNDRYGKYLTPAAFNRRYAPTNGQVDRVKSYLRSQGLHVDGVAAGHRWINATGSVSDMNQAFGTTLRTYRYKGHSLRAPGKKASLPATVSRLVLSVSGLTNTAPLRRPFHHQVAAPTAAGAQPKAGSKSADAEPTPAKCSNFWGEHSQKMPDAYGRSEFPTYLCGYTPDQLQTGYGIKGDLAVGQDGSGTTIAIVDAYAAPTMKADADKFSKANQQPTFTKGQYSEKVFKPFGMQDECGGEDGWNGEEAIDVESAHAMAPAANIQYVGAKDCDTGLNEALNWIVQKHAADVVSDSWGNLGEDVPAGDIKAEHTIFVQAAAEGIGMYFSSGDSGDEVTAGNTPSAQPDYPASDPFVTAVGGTSLAVGVDGSYGFETGWGDDVDTADYTQDPAGYEQALPGYFYAGAGGGTSTLFDQPDYQKDVVPASLAHKYGGDSARVAPDVAALADPYTGMAIGRTTGGEYTVQTWGGTSLACPLFAGIQAVASTDRATAIGFANPLLYSLSGSDAYHDVAPQRTPVALATPTGSSLVTLDHDSSLATSYGYDNVTGLGSPNGKRFVRAVANG